MSMRWEILSEGVRKSPTDDVPKNLVFHEHCWIKLINFYSYDLVWPFWSDIAFLDSADRWLDAIWIIILMGYINFQTPCM